jgi:hypothetical protein
MRQQLFKRPKEVQEKLRGRINPKGKSQWVQFMLLKPYLKMLLIYKERVII